MGAIRGIPKDLIDASRQILENEPIETGKNINPAGAVNMYFVGDDFAFDFVPEDAKQDKGVWSEFAEEGLGLTDKELSDVDTMLQLENEMEMGK